LGQERTQLRHHPEVIPPQQPVILSQDKSAEVQQKEVVVAHLPRHLLPIPTAEQVSLKEMEEQVKVHH
jgi:hypothetical protein